MKTLRGKALNSLTLDRSTHCFLVLLSITFACPDFATPPSPLCTIPSHPHLLSTLTISSNFD